MKSFIQIICVMLLVALQACRSNKESVDSIYFNGHIYTMDSAVQTAEVMIVQKGKIIDIGSKALLEVYSSEQLIDLKGEWVYPGFIDAHCHFLGHANNQLQCQLMGSPSWKAILDSLVIFEKTLQKDEPLLGRGWDQNDWPEHSFPNNQVLNDLFPDRPVILKRIDGHAAICNQKALDMCKINLKSQIKGGEIIQSNQQLTGVLIDNAVNLVDHFFSYQHNQKLLQAIQKTEQYCFSKGLTSLADAGLPLKECLYLDSLGKTHERQIFLYLMLNPDSNAIAFAKSKGIYENDLTQIGAFKLYADGALGSRGAKLKEDYCDRFHHNGYWVTEAKTIQAFCQDIYQNTNYQVNTHCIGDSANVLLLNLYGQQLKTKNDRRWRIEHAQLVDPKDRALFGKYSIIPSVQPTHATSDAPWVNQRICEQRLPSAYAYKSLLNQNGYLALGTDFPVEYIDPFYTIYSAVFRLSATQTLDKPFIIDEHLSIDQTLKGMTIWAAKACRLEHRKGSLTKGKDADFVVINRDFYHLKQGKDILTSEVLMTVVKGKKVY